MLILPLFGLVAASAPALMFGPTHYQQVSDNTHFTPDAVEDFEDHLLNTPGITSVGSGFVTSTVYSHSRDSVDADDGTIDGFGGGSVADSWYGNNLAFAFDLGGSSVPTFAGLVITDASVSATVPHEFRAYDRDNNLIGSVLYSFPEPSEGSTIDDYFVGAYFAGGIARIEVSGDNVTEVDHIQYAGLVPEPATGSITLAGVALLGRRRKR